MTTDADRAAAARALGQVFAASDPAGRPRFSEEEILNYLPLLFMQAAQASPGLAISKDVERFLAGFAQTIGVGPNTPPAEATKKLAAHYAKHPVNPGLKSAFEQALREQTAQLSAAALSELASRSGARASLEGYRSDHKRPEGALSGGPLARFQVTGALPPKKD